MNDLLPSLLLAIVEGGEVRETVAYELQRLAQWDDARWLWLGLAVAMTLLIGAVVWLYRRESAQLSPLFRCVLPLLRSIAYAGIVLFFLGIEKRTDRYETVASRVLLLVDTSQSMAVEDETSVVDSANQAKHPRATVLTQALAKLPLIVDLSQEHVVELATFDTELQRVAQWSSAPTNVTPTWEKDLAPTGVETRLGDALREALDTTANGPLAAVIVFSDGGQNRGVDPLAMADAAQLSGVPIHTVGIGSTLPRRNIRVKELLAPSRVYPEDKTTIVGLVQNEGYAGRSVTIELLASEARGTETTQPERIDSTTARFEKDGQVVRVEFEIEPAEIGRLLLELRVATPADDQFADDDHRSVEIEVVDAQTRTLLIASGPTREYRFLRNQLRRDRHATVDVWLQSAGAGASQDADNLLDGFPTSKEDLYSYDCIVAFDPNWQQLDAQQVELLEKWVAEEAGGLIVVAGPIHTSSWVQSPEHGKIRALYPVEFQRRLTLLDDGQYGSETPWPIVFSRDGEQADFLRLVDTPEESRLLWSKFSGVYGCYAVKGPKSGARVLGRYSDPDAGLSAERPVYLAEHFYGAGRVFYIGSGEFWRLRSEDPRYFEVIYTKLIRHTSQGRLLRGSSHGQLLVERDRYSVNDTVVVRAQLSTSGREPLIVPRVTIQVVDPAGVRRNQMLLADPNRLGSYLGQFTVPSEGMYRILLPVPGIVDEQLVRRIQVSIPNLEFDHTRRNEPLLAALANRTGGHYFISLTSAMNGSPKLQPLAEQIESRAETRTIRGTADPKFTEWLHRVLLTVICGALCLEWLLRRTLKLA